MARVCKELGKQSCLTRRLLGQEWTGREKGVEGTGSVPDGASFAFPFAACSLRVVQGITGSLSLTLTEAEKTGHCPWRERGLEAERDAVICLVGPLPRDNLAAGMRSTGNGGRRPKG